MATHSATEHEEHHPKLQHHFYSMDQQLEASILGMWVFLVTEVMFFGGLFMAYIVYRTWYPIARIDAPADDMTFKTWNSSGYEWYRRGIPRYPRMNCGKNVRLKPANTRIADVFASDSLYILPVIFGHQWCRPPRKAMTVPPIIT